jgi:hypothetical protein
LALHFFNDGISNTTLSEIDKIDIKYNCMANLVKDSRIAADAIEKHYPNCEKFIRSVKKYDPSLMFSNLIIEKIFK